MKNKSSYIQKLTSRKILSILEKHKSELKKYNLSKLGLFGSFSKGTAHKKSDLDFLVSFKHPSFDNYIELKFLLEKVFQRKIDLVMEENLKPSLQYVKKEAHYLKKL